MRAGLNSRQTCSSQTGPAQPATRINHDQRTIAHFWPKVNTLRGMATRTQGCIKLPGPRTVPVRNGAGGFWTFRFSGHLGMCLRAASRDVSRSDAELDTALPRTLANAPLRPARGGMLSG